MSALQDFTIQNGVLTQYTGSGGAVVVPEGVTEIGESAFYSCTNLTQITLPSGLTRIGGGAFRYCTNLTQIEFPEGLIEIENRAFGCTGFTQMTLPESLTELGIAAFENCTGLTQITLPKSLAKLNPFSFAGCTSLTRVSLPPNLTEIDSWAFQGCTSLAQIDLPQALTGIGIEAFEKCTSLTLIALPPQLTRVEHGAFLGCKNLTEFRVHPNNPVLHAEGGALYQDGEHGRALISYPTACGAVTVPEGVETIGEFVFCNCDALTQISLPASLRKILSRAFLNCTGLTRIEFPERLTWIGESAFQNCDRLTQLDLPKGVRVILSNAFRHCTGLTQLTLPEGLREMGDGAFGGCTGLTQVRIPQGLKELRCAFQNCTGLTQIDVPEGVTELRNMAFAGCTGLTQINLPKSLKHIFFQAFSGCTGLTKLTLPEGVTTLSFNIFENAANLNAITLLSRGPLYLENHTFDNCPAVIRAPYLPLGTFASSDKFRVVQGFAQLYAEHFAVPEDVRAGYLKYIKSQKRRLYSLAIKDAALLNLMIQENILPKEDVGELLEEAQAGDNLEVKAILLEFQNRNRKPGEAEEALLGAFDLEEADNLTPAEAKKIWRYEKTDKGKIRILGYKGRKLEITIPARIGGAPVTEIGPNAFSPTQKPLLKEQRELRENITSVKIPEGVTAIGASAFEGCAALTQLEFPESLRSLNSSQKICKNCTALIQIRLPNVKQIPNEAFAGCEALERIVIPASVTKIAQKAFSCGWIGQCPKLTIHAPAGSYAEQFAKERDISFQAI